MRLNCASNIRKDTNEVRFLGRTPICKGAVSNAKIKAFEAAPFKKFAA